MLMVMPGLPLGYKHLQLLYSPDLLKAMMATAQGI